MITTKQRVAVGMESGGKKKKEKKKKKKERKKKGSPLNRGYFTREGGKGTTTRVQTGGTFMGSSMSYISYFVQGEEGERGGEARRATEGGGGKDYRMTVFVGRLREGKGEKRGLHYRDGREMLLPTYYRHGGGRKKGKGGGEGAESQDDAQLQGGGGKGVVFFFHL